MSNKPLNILILYDSYATYINTTYEYLRSFQLYSKHNIQYLVATQQAECPINLDQFDIIIIHYCIRLCFPWHLSPYYAKALEEYKGYKVLFIQDEYDFTEIARSAIQRFSIKLVFTCVPKPYISIVYPPERFPHTQFIQVLTGYAPLNYKKLKSYYKPFSQREFQIGYRGRALSYRYGDLGQEKLNIAKRMFQICEKKDIKVNIKWDDSERIHGEDWYRFLASSKATLGTESGSNIFDDDGSIGGSVKKALESNPNTTYQEIFEEYLANHEGRVRMNQISPRIFESIALKVALVLFEGKYSDIVKPNVHYIPLKKDFSNVNEVLKKLEDDVYLEELTERAYQDIIGSKKYTYENFIAMVDGVLTEECSKNNDNLDERPILHLTSSASLSFSPVCYWPTNLPMRPEYFKELLLMNPVSVTKKERFLSNVKKYSPSIVFKSLLLVRFVWRKVSRVFV